MMCENVRTFRLFLSLEKICERFLVFSPRISCVLSLPGKIILPIKIACLKLEAKDVKVTVKHMKLTSSILLRKWKEIPIEKILKNNSFFSSEINIRLRERYDHLSICPSVHLSHLSHLSICPSVHLPICLYIYVTWSIHAETQSGRIVARLGLFSFERFSHYCSCIRMIWLSGVCNAIAAREVTPRGSRKISDHMGPKQSSPWDSVEGGRACTRRLSINVWISSLSSWKMR